MVGKIPNVRSNGGNGLAIQNWLSKNWLLLVALIAIGGVFYELAITVSATEKSTKENARKLETSPTKSDIKLLVGEKLQPLQMDVNDIKIVVGRIEEKLDAETKIQDQILDRQKNLSHRIRLLESETGKMNNHISDHPGR